MSIPWATSEWNEIIPGLYQGGHVYRVNGLPFHTKLKGVRDFDYVFSLYYESKHSYPGTWPDDDIAHTVWEIADDTWLGVREEDKGPLRNHVEDIARRVTNGEKVLVRCQAGYNRSGLVVALVLVRLGWQVDAAIAAVREKRSIWALVNKKFEEFIRANAHEYWPGGDPVADRPGGGSEPS